MRATADALGLGFAPLGFHPLAPRGEMPWMPKGRYAIMRRYMPKVGALGLDMMTRTCTVQVNLDYASEADMVRKLRVIAGVAAGGDCAVRQFAVHRGPAEWVPVVSRACLDRHRQPAHRHPAVFFEEDFGFERYVEWLLDVPMYFVYRDGRYIDLAGAVVPPVHGRRA